MSDVLAAQLLVEAYTKKELARVLRKAAPALDAVEARQKLVQQALELDLEVDELEAMAVSLKTACA